MPIFRTAAPPDLLGAVRGTIAKLNSEADSGRQQGESRLAGAARRLMGSFGRKGLSPLEEIEVDRMAADHAHKLALVEKVRDEVDRRRQADELRRNPDERARFAGDVAGLDSGQDAVRFGGHLRGETEPYHPADADDAAAVGADYRPYRMAAPNLRPGQRERFQAGMAALRASALATGDTNADQLAHAVDRATGTTLMSRAAEETDVPTANRLTAARTGRAREPFAVGRQGQVLNQETGDVNEEPVLAQAAQQLLEARTATEGAREREVTARAGSREARPSQASRETALERNLKHLVTIGAAADERSALELLRRPKGKSEQDAILGLSKVLMQRPAYIGKDGPARAMADATAIVRSGSAKPPAAATFKTAEDVRAAFKAGKIDRAAALRELEQFGFDPE